MAEKRSSEFPCAVCPLHKRADANPKGFIARIWRWHTGWCPGWRGYQAALAREGASGSA